MDYIQYVNETVSDPEIQARIIKAIEFCHQNSSGEGWKSCFSNNFYALLPGFSKRIIWENEYSPETKFKDYKGYEYGFASEKIREQTPREFFQTIDAAIKKLDISLEDIVNSISTDCCEQSRTSFDYFFKIIVELMVQGYNRYPDLTI